MRSPSTVSRSVAETGNDASYGIVDEYDFIDESSQYRNKDLPNAMTVDVEDYFQVSAFNDRISRGSWDEWPDRLPGTMERILELFEEAGVTATFFTLGCVCEKFPNLVRNIVAGGHELASHGYDHVRVWNQSAKEFREDVGRTRKILEDVAGVAVRGYRAPSFSISEESLWAYDVLHEAGYSYSSSVYPIKHDHYGLPNAPTSPFRVGVDGVLEIPMAAVSMLGRRWPCAGGGYFRLLPLAYSRWAIRQINNGDQMPAVFYFHPWEMDAEQPRVSNVPLKTRFRHYVNLSRFESRITTMLRDFHWRTMGEIYLPE